MTDKQHYIQEPALLDGDTEPIEPVSGELSDLEQQAFFGEHDIAWWQLTAIHMENAYNDAMSDLNRLRTVQLALRTVREELLADRERMEDEIVRLQQENQRLRERVAQYYEEQSK